MKPNQNFLKYFPDAELPERKNRTSRSSCLRVRAYFVLRKIIEECSLKDILGKYFGSRDMGLFLDLAVYSIIAENNAAQYYPDYTYNHPLFTEKMKQYSDSTVSDFLNSVTDDQSTGFLNTWNESRNYREKIYISYDSTNKNCQDGDIKMVEFGYPKVDMGEPVFNYAVAYDTHNQEPLFYEKYPGSLNDISQLQCNSKSERTVRQAGCYKKRRNPVSSCKTCPVSEFFVNILPTNLQSAAFDGKMKVG